MNRLQKIRLVTQGLNSNRCIHKGKAMMTVSSSNPQSVHAPVPAHPETQTERRSRGSQTS
ncbi:hypothetical protein B0O80DRAFT_462762 [Mortierella sp. GBAus27b]|nr:hypothetical protein B0O80DRAFT_462762 [Mortierella sp. GBAus27b]